MPNQSKRLNKFGFDGLSLEFGGKLHRYFFDGFHAALRQGLGDYEKAEGYRFLEKLESVLVQSGYMAQWEIDLRHQEKKSLEKPLIIDPYNIQ